MASRSGRSIRRFCLLKIEPREHAALIGGLRYPSRNDLYDQRIGRVRGVGCRQAPCGSAHHGPPWPSAQACRVGSHPLLGVDSRGVSPALGIPNYGHGCGDLPAPIDAFTGRNYGDNMVHFGNSFCLVLPHIFGLLMAIIMPFMVTSFAWTLPDFRWRHMFGVPSFCCGLSSTLNTNMVLASTLCLTSIATVGVALVLFVRGIPAMQVTRVISGAIMVIGVGGFGGSAMIAQSLENFAATQPRDIRESVCRNGMCFWPEHTEKQIAANSAAYDQIRATMPAQWLPPTSPTTPAISPDPNFKIGVINESSWILGEPNSPLPFTDSVDNNEIYGHFANILVSRQLRFLIPLIDADNWQKWASHQSKPASPEEVYSWVESELKQLGLSDIKPQ